MKVWIKGEAHAYEVDMPAERLWDDHKDVMRGVKQVTLLLKRGQRTVAKSIRRLDGERTFTMAIIDAHDTLPPPPAVPRFDTMTSSGVSMKTPVPS